MDVLVLQFFTVTTLSILAHCQTVILLGLLGQFNKAEPLSVLLITFMTS